MLGCSKGFDADLGRTFRLVYQKDIADLSAEELCYVWGSHRLHVKRNGDLECVSGLIAL